jgi:GT2 family glycosyltransferase
MSKAPLVTIGILSYRDKKYLEKGLPSLLAQDYANFEIFICDNNEDPTEEIKKWLNAEFPTIKVFSAGGNVGFGRGHNHLISQAKGEYYLGFNSDMYAAPDFVSKLVAAIEQDEKIGCVTGKLLQWSNFPENPEQIIVNTIDTAGVIAHKSHYFHERGHGEGDNGQFDEEQEIWGASGAAPIFRMKALQDIDQSENEFFDKNFFMYKEDIDLMYRLRWAGWKIVYTPSPCAWHDRTAADPGGIIENIKKRRTRAAYVKENSFFNHLQFVEKNFSTDYSFGVKFRTALFFLKYFLYLLIFDFKVLKQYGKFKKLKPHLHALRKKMPRRISAQEMENWLI